MVKYVDAGSDTAGGGAKKKMRKGFKTDRLENYKRMLAKKSGKKVKEAPAHVVRPKSLMFDDASRREYLLTLHKKKNERRVQAFVDAKRKHRKESAKTRREQREEARRAYNNYARVPILPDYTYRLPQQQDEGFDEEAVEDGDSDDGHHSSAFGDDTKGSETGDMGEMPWISVDASEVPASLQRRRAKRLATSVQSFHPMPGAMLGHAADNCAPDHVATASSSAELDDEWASVEVKPLFGKPHSMPGDDGGASQRHCTPSHPLPSNNFDDLPAVVQQELRRLRQETKGPAKTKPRLHMMKELEKIRKIRKHSRKGHGKRKASGKRKNRKK